MQPEFTASTTHGHQTPLSMWLRGVARKISLRIKLLKFMPDPPMSVKWKASQPYVNASNTTQSQQNYAETMINA